MTPYFQLPIDRFDRRTDFVSECVMQILKEEYHPEYRHYIREGKFNVKKISENAVKIYKTIKKFVGEGTYAKKVYNFLSDKTSWKVLPSLLGGGFKRLNPKLCKQVVYTAEFRKKTKDITIGDAIKVGEKAFEVEIEKRKYIMSFDYKDIMAGIVDLLDSIVELVTTLLSFIPGWGNVIEAAINLCWCVLKNLWAKFESECERIWQIVKDFIKAELGISIDDIKEAWNKFKGWAKDVGNACREWASEVAKDPVGYARASISYGGARGVALKDALDYLEDVRGNLKNTKSSQLELKMKYIACVYRNKKTVSQKEFDTTKKFCNDILNLEIPSYTEAMKKWPGINRAKDDGTYASYILASFPWNVLTNDKKAVASWFVKSCKIGRMKFSELEKEFAKIKVPTGKGKVYK